MYIYTSSKSQSQSSNANHFRETAGSILCSNMHQKRRTHISKTILVSDISAVL